MNAPIIWENWKVDVERILNEKCSKVSLTRLSGLRPSSGKHAASRFITYINDEDYPGYSHGLFDPKRSYKLHHNSRVGQPWLSERTAQTLYEALQRLAVLQDADCAAIRVHAETALRTIDEQSVRFDAAA